MRNAYFIVGLLIGVGLTLFALQNTAAVEIRFLFWQAQGPLAAVVLLSAIGGLVIALLFGLPEIISARWRIRSLQRRLGGSEPRPHAPTPAPSREEETPRAP